jgi:hypothetical protein
VGAMATDRLDITDRSDLAERWEIHVPRRVQRMLDDAMGLLDEHVKPDKPHGNERLHYRGVVGALLCAAFEPAVRSLRTIDDLSLFDSVRQCTGAQRVARSTLSDALARFDPAALKPVIQALAGQMPQLKRLDGDTESITRRIIAGDGSWWNLAGEVTHALQMRRGNTDNFQSRVRLNLQLDVDSFLPTDFDVSGAGDGSEAAAFARNLQSGVVYLVDRNFTHFGFINAVLHKGSNLVLRLRKDVLFAAEKALELSEKDRQHNIRLDQIGHLSGPASPSNQGRKSRTDVPPAAWLRRIVVWDEKNQCELILLTDLLDVPAYVIAALYRRRWQIELFLRWLKVLASFDHLVSQSPKGITMQFYVAVLMTLLIHLHTGRRVSKYALLWVGWVARGQASPQQMAEALARHERERELEKKRRAKSRVCASKKGN